MDEHGGKSGEWTPHETWRVKTWAFAIGSIVVADHGAELVGVLENWEGVRASLSVVAVIVLKVAKEYYVNNRKRR